MQAVFALALTDASAPRGGHNAALPCLLSSCLPRPAETATTARV